MSYPPPAVQPIIIQGAPAQPVQYVAQPQRPPNTEGDKIVLVLLIILFPPLAVYYRDKQCNCHVFLNVFLLMLLIIPGLIHAVWYCFMQ